MNTRESEKRYRILITELEKFAERYGYRFDVESTPVADQVKIRFRNGVHGWGCEVHLSETGPCVEYVIDKIKAEAQNELTNTGMRRPHDDSIDALFYTYYSDRYKRAKIIPYALQIKDVIFNDPATIVFWMDGTKTVVKAQDGEPFDPEKGLAMAISKKALGNQGNYYNVFAKWCPEEEETKTEIEIKFDGKALTEAIRKFGRANRELEEIMRENAQRIIKNGCRN